jgi:hypothetical protein
MQEICDRQDLIQVLNQNIDMLNTQLARIKLSEMLMEDQIVNKNGEILAGR